MCITYQRSHVVLTGSRNNYVRPYFKQFFPGVTKSLSHISFANFPLKISLLFSKSVSEARDSSTLLLL